MAFLFVEQPRIPGPILRHLAKQAIAHRSFNEKIDRDWLNARTPLESLLQDQPVHTLITWGDQDRVLHVSGAGILAAIMPNAQAAVMPDVGHLPMVERPQKTAERFLQFQADLGRASDRH